MHIVEQENNEALGRGSGTLWRTGHGSIGGRDCGCRRGCIAFRRCSLLNGKTRNLAGLVLIEDVEVFFLEMADGMASSVADDHGRCV